MTKQATLPEYLEDNTLASLMTGEIGYMVPWGMWVDKERRCWLHPNYTVGPSPHGTASMKVELREDGFHLWPPLDSTWQPQERASYFGSEDVEFIPVAELH